MKFCTFGGFVVWALPATLELDLFLILQLFSLQRMTARGNVPTFLLYWALLIYDFILALDLVTCSRLFQTCSFSALNLLSRWIKYEQPVHLVVQFMQYIYLSLHVQVRIPWYLSRMRRTESDAPTRRLTPTSLMHVLSNWQLLILMSPPIIVC